MRVGIKLAPEYRPPFAVIYADVLTDEIRRAEAFLKGDPSTLLVRKETGSAVLHPEEICLVRVEDGRTVVYTKKDRFESDRRLYEIQSQLDDSFIRISKQAVVSRRAIRSVEVGGGGSLRLVLRNGQEEYVSLKYLPELKASLGLRKGARI